MSLEQQSIPRHFGWLSFSQWVGLTLAGFLLVMFLHFPGDSATDGFYFRQLDLSAAALGFVFGAISGLIIAALQWIALKPWIPRLRLWFSLNAVAYGLVHAIYDGVPFQYNLVVTGIIVGLIQYIALRHLLSKPILWAPIAAVAWFVGFQVGFALSNGDEPINLITVGVITGVITGLALRFFIIPVDLAPSIQSNPRPSTSLSNRILRVSLWAVVAAIVVYVASVMFGLTLFG